MKYTFWKKEKIGGKLRENPLIYYSHKYREEGKH